MKNVPRLLVFIALSLLAPLGAAQIQIHPLPEPQPAVVTPLGAHPLTATDVAPWLDGMFADALRRTDASAAVVVVVKDGEVLLAKGYGHVDRATGKPVDPATTLFRLGSVSKTFTWTAVMQLAEQGKLDLDADVNRYLDFTIPPFDGKPVTLRELMTHTAGFEEVVKNLSGGATAQAMGDQAWFVRWLKQSLPARVYPPGEVPAYSNYGAALAGYIVQRVSGQPFTAYVEQHILQPLGMQHASFRQPLPASLASDMAKSYAWDGRTPWPFEIRSAIPAGGLSASGGDMARFMIAQLQDGRYGDAQILGAPALRQMHDYTHAAVPGLLPMALGFWHMDRNGQNILGHAGDVRGFHSEMALFPQAHVGVFVAVDGATDGGLRTLLLDGFADRYFPALPQQPVPTLTSAREHGAMLVGRYIGSRTSIDNFRDLRNLLGQSRVLMAPDGSLITPSFRDLAGRPRRWREVQPFIWLDDASGSHLGARIEHGTVRWIGIDESAPTMVYLRVPAWRSAAWNLPLLNAALWVFALAALLWPVAALVRRACGKSFMLSSSARRWYRASRIVAVLQLLFMAGWLFALKLAFSSGFDGMLRLIQLVALLALAGTLAVVANAYHAWREPGGWWRKANSTALVLACLVTLWIVGCWHLLSLQLIY